jgi:hypothetical protein
MNRGLMLLCLADRTLNLGGDCDNLPCFDNDTPRDDIESLRVHYSYRQISAMSKWTLLIYIHIGHWQ